MVKCSVKLENMNSLLLSLPWDPSYPGPSQLRFPHSVQLNLPSPPTSVTSSCLCTNCLVSLEYSFSPSSVIQHWHFSPWKAPGRSSATLPGRELSQHPPIPLSGSITLWIVAPGYRSVSSLSRPGAPPAHEPCLSHHCSLTTHVMLGLRKVR